MTKTHEEDTGDEKKGNGESAYVGLSDYDNIWIYVRTVMPAFLK